MTESMSHRYIDAAGAAPDAPGQLGVALEPGAIATYLTDLDGWIRGRKHELDELDAAALAANRGGAVAGDMMLSLALWKAVSERYQLLSATWDGGRVLAAERERISSLIWGRLDGSTGLPGGLAVSVPEACRLCDALAGQLRTALALTPGADASAARLKALRAQLERLRDQIALEPVTLREGCERQRAALAARAQDLTERAERGGDIAGRLGPLEADATVLERDLIVGNAQRRDARDLLASARELRADLERRETALERLAQLCVATVNPAPRNAVPDVGALGPIPNTAEAIGGYVQRLDRVSEALTFAQHKYADALAEHTDLVSLLDGYAAKAGALGLRSNPDLEASEASAREVLDRRPAPMIVCRQLVTTYQTWLDAIEKMPRTPDRPQES